MKLLQLPFYNFLINNIQPSRFCNMTTLKSSLGSSRRLFIALCIFCIGSLSVGAQENEMQFKNEVSVDYVNCTGVAKLKFPVRSNDGSNFANFLRYIEISVSQPGSIILLGRVYFDFISVSNTECSTGSPTISLTTGGALRTWNYCAVGANSSLAIVNGPGSQRFMELTVNDLPNTMFGAPITFGMSGWYDLECCENTTNLESFFGYEFTHFASWNNSTNSASVAVPNVTSSMASDCRTATINWGAVSLPAAGCGSIEYEVRRNGGTVFGPITGTSFVDNNFNTFLTPGAAYTYEVRSKWTPQGSSRLNTSLYSGSTPNVNIPLENGMISGTVKSAGGVPIAGVTVTATRISVDPMPFCQNYSTPATLNATTNGNGFYQMQNIYYGHPSDSKTTYRVSASPNGNPTDTEDVDLDDMTPSASADLIDSTSYIIQGRVLSANGCGVEDAAISADGLSPGNVIPIEPDTTDADGYYTLSVPGADNYEITSTYTTPNNTVVNVITRNVNTNPYNNADIQYSRTNIVQGFVGGSCNAIFGPATVTAYTKNGCPIASTTSNAGTGMYSMTLPAIEMDIKVENYNPTMGPLTGPLAQIQEIDLDSTTTLDFIFRVPISLEVVGMPKQVCSDIAFPILEQFRPYVITYVVTEGMSCPVDTGYVLISDEIRSKDATMLEFDTLRISNGIALDTIIPGVPNIFGDFSKTLLIEAFAGSNANNLVPAPAVTVQAVVTGSAPRGQQFTTVSPQIPRLIVRDPPGGGSFSEITESSTFSTTSSLYTQDAKAESGWVKAKVGVEIALISLEAGIEIGASFGGESVNINSEERLYEFTAESTYSTSDDPNITGEDGDVYIGSAMNLTYANSDILSLDLASCSINKRVELVIAPETFETEFVYAEADIVNLVIPALQTIVDDESQSDIDRHRSREGIRIWNQIISLNAKLKEDAFNGPVNPLIPVGNNSFGGSAGFFSRSFTTTTTESTTIEWKQLIDTKVAVEAGFSLSGSGVSGGYEINLKEEFGGSTTNGVSTSTTVGFTFDDSDATDIFTVDYAIDPVFGTPVFRAAQNAGQSSCPWELGAKVDQPIFSIQNPIQYVAAGLNTVEINFLLTNGSETGDTRDYILRMVNNPQNLEVVTNGFADQTWDILNMAPGVQRVQQVRFNRDINDDDFHFENIRFEFVPECAEAEQVAERSVSIFFESPCSDISFTPSTINAGFLINQNSTQTVNIGMTGYDYPAIGNNDILKLQWAPAGTDDWNPTNISLTKSQIVNNNPARTNKVWNTPIVPDTVRNIDIRLELSCTIGPNASSTYSERITGIIDRLSPQVLGIPFPEDDDYASGDTIAVLFDEMIDCINTTVTLTMLPDNIIVPATFNCMNNSLSISPSYDISVETGKIFKVEIGELEDLYGNVIDEAYTWEFSVGEIDSDGDGYTDSYEQCIGSALHFERTQSSHVVVPHNNALNVVENGLDFTFEAWVFAESENLNTIIAKGSGVANLDDNEFIFTLRSVGGVPYRLGLFIANEWQYGNSTVPQHQWTHVAVAVDGATRQAQFYINGIPDGNPTYVSTSMATGNIDPLYIGRQGTLTTGGYFKGRMDDVIIWQHELTQAEIMATMAGDLTGTETDLVANYDFDDYESCVLNTGNNTVFDKSTNANNGTLNNFVLDGCISNWATERFMDNDRDGIPDSCDEIEPCFDLNDTSDTDGDLLLACVDLCPATKDVALDFIGTNNFLAFNHTGSIADSSFAFEAWVNPVDENEMGIFFGQDSDVNPSYGLILRYQKIVLVLFENSTTNKTEYLYSTTDVPLNKWSHIAVSFDAETKQATFYLNGEFDAVRESELNSIYSPTNNTLLIGVGRDSFGVSSFYNGRMDDFAVWSRTLSDYNIKQTMSAPLSGSENGLVAYFDFNEGLACADNTTITTALNKNTSNNNATLIGFSKTTCMSNYVTGRNTDSDGDMIGDACDVSAFGCPPNYAGANQLIGDQKYNTFFDTDGAIESIQTIEDPVGVIYNSSTSIEFLPNFEVELGSTLEIKLDGCPD